MSLNRSEQRIEDYLQGHKEERQFWISKVQSIFAREIDTGTAAARIEGELWRYYVERSAVVPEFKQAARLEGLERTSMRNLADHLIRMYTVPRKKPKQVSGNVTQQILAGLDN